MTGRAKRSYTFWWFFQRFTGVVLVVTLLVHMFGQHFSLESGPHRSHLSLDGIAARFENPWWMLFYLVFLFTGLVHGFNGVYNVVDDYIRSPGWRMVCTWGIWFTGIVLFFWGTMTVFA